MFLAVQGVFEANVAQCKVVSLGIDARLKDAINLVILAVNLKFAIPKCYNTNKYVSQ